MSFLLDPGTASVVSNYITILMFAIAILQCGYSIYKRVKVKKRNSKFNKEFLDKICSIHKSKPGKRTLVGSLSNNI